MTAPTPVVCVFCGSAFGHGESYRELAVAAGRRIAESGWHVVYGGGHVGLMGAMADAARAHGAVVTGVIPRALFAREVGHGGIDELVVVATMAERKVEMARRSHAYLVLPGGLGTLDELFEVLTLSLLRIDVKPCVLLNVAGFFDPLLEQLRHMHEQGFLAAPLAEVLTVAATLDDAMAALTSG